MSELMDTVKGNDFSASNGGADERPLLTVNRAKVINNGDASRKGQIEVEFINSDEPNNWVRLTSPYAGKEYANYIVPEVDEEVLVGVISGNKDSHEQNEITYFLIGCVHPNDEAYVSDSKSFNENNWNKHFKTMGEVDFHIYDEPDKQSFTLTTPKGHFIKIEDEKETCTISDKDGKNYFFFDFKNGKLEILADKEITLKTGKVEFTMKGDEGEYSLKGEDIKQKANKSVDINGKNTIKLSGDAADLEATASTVNVKGVSLATVKASSVQVG